MIHLILKFLNSQMFGIILGAIITGGFTFLLIVINLLEKSVFI